VLEGELEVSVGENTFEAGVGSFVLLPKGVPHSFQNVGAVPARFLTLIAPAGLERFFEEVGKPGTDPSSPPPMEEADMNRLMQAAPNYGVEIWAPSDP
jgi:glyoxylate utilization-related uncharacterized protein